MDGPDGESPFDLFNGKLRMEGPWENSRFLAHNAELPFEPLIKGMCTAQVLDLFFCCRDFLILELDG